MHTTHFTGNVSLDTEHPCRNEPPVVFNVHGPVTPVAIPRRLLYYIARTTTPGRPALPRYIVALCL